MPVGGDYKLTSVKIKYDNGSLFPEEGSIPVGVSADNIVWTQGINWDQVIGLDNRVTMIQNRMNNTVVGQTLRLYFTTTNVNNS